MTKLHSTRVPDLGGVDEMTLDKAVERIATKIMKERAGTERLTLEEWEHYLRALLRYLTQSR